MNTGHRPGNGSRLLAIATAVAWAAASGSAHYGPTYDAGSTAPPAVTQDIEALIGEFADRWSSAAWYTLLDLWDPDEETPYYLSSHQPDWLIGWDQMRGYFAEQQVVPVKELPEPLPPGAMGQLELVHYEFRNEADLEAMRYTASDIRARQIAPDLAIAAWYVKFEYKPRFQPAMGETFKANAVFRKTENGWKFIHYAETPDSAIMYIERLYRQQASPEFVEMTSRKSARKGGGKP